MLLLSILQLSPIATSGAIVKYASYDVISHVINWQVVSG